MFSSLIKAAFPFVFPQHLKEPNLPVFFSPFCSSFYASIDHLFLSWHLSFGTSQNWSLVTIYFLNLLSFLQWCPFGHGLVYHILYYSSQMSISFHLSFLVNIFTCFGIAFPSLIILYTDIYPCPSVLLSLNMRSSSFISNCVWYIASFRLSYGCAVSQHYS